MQHISGETEYIWSIGGKSGMKDLRVMGDMNWIWLRKGTNGGVF
jgi:hypothetical protein